MITSDGIELKVTTQGRATGRGAILLHGLGGNPSVWSDTGPALAPRFKVILPALRGHGGSEVGASVNLSRLVEDVFEICDEFSLHEATLIGHGLGAVVAMMAVAAMPERASAMVLVGASATPLSATSGWAQTRARAAEVAGRTSMADAWEVYLEGGIFGVSGDDIPREIMHRWRSEFLAVDNIAFSNLATELATHEDVATGLAGLGRPTLVITGSDDQPYADRAEQLAERTGGELEWIPGGGHSPQLARAELFNEILVAFLRRVLPPKT